MFLDIWSRMSARHRRAILAILTGAVFIGAQVVAILPSTTQVPRLQDWTGLFRYTGSSQAPYGWINTSLTGFHIVKDDHQDARQNISSATLQAYSIFAFAQSEISAMQISARDQGMYRDVPLQVKNVSSLGVPPFAPANFSYMDASSINYQVGVSGSVSVHIHPLDSYYYPVLDVSGSQPGGFISEFQGFPTSAQSRVILSGQGISLYATSTPINLTGKATLTITRFTRAGLTGFGMSQMFKTDSGTRLAFQNASFDLHNLNGTIQSPQAGVQPLRNASLIIGSTTSAGLVMFPQVDYHDPSTSLTFQANGAIVGLAGSNPLWYPGAATEEQTGLILIHAVAQGALNLVGVVLLERLTRGKSTSS